MTSSLIKSVLRASRASRAVGTPWAKPRSRSRIAAGRRCLPSSAVPVKALKTRPQAPQDTEELAPRHADAAVRGPATVDVDAIPGRLEAIKQHGTLRLLRNRGLVSETEPPRLTAKGARDLTPDVGQQLVVELVRRQGGAASRGERHADG